MSARGTYRSGIISGVCENRFVGYMASDFFASGRVSPVNIGHYHQSPVVSARQHTHRQPRF